MRKERKHVDYPYTTTTYDEFGGSYTVARPKYLVTCIQCGGSGKIVTPDKEIIMCSTCKGIGYGPPGVCAQ
jgi:DnaJ-class molecular chaperone